MSRLSEQKWFQRADVLLLANLLIFQVGWFVCVTGGTVWAVPYTLAALLAHQALQPRADKDWPLIVIAVTLGLVHDNFLVAAGILKAGNATLVAPLWLACLWALLGTTLQHSMRWVYHRPVMAALFGAVGGPLAYAYGVALSDMKWNLEPLAGCAIIACLWFMVLPLHRLLLRRWYACRL